MSGVPCPNCKELIGLDLLFIVKNPVSQCPHCAVVMKFNIDETTITKYKQALADIENIKKQHKGVKFELRK